MKKYWVTLKELYERFDRAEVSTRAAALAYHTLLGIIPSLGLFFWYLSSVQITDHWFSLTKKFVLTQLNVDSSTVFLKYFDKLTSAVSGQSWGWIGLIIFTYTAFSLVSKFGDSIDQILETHPSKNIFERKWFHLFGRRILALLTLPLALVLSLAVSQWIRKDSILNRLFELKTFGAYFALPLAWAGSISAAFLIYYLIPKKRVPWQQALKVACYIGPTSEILRFLFGIYNRYAISVHKIYGVFAVVPLFILYIQISWVLLLSGALLIQFEKKRSTR